MVFMLFKVIYTVIKEKIIRGRTWEETKNKLNDCLDGDSVFKT